MLHVSLMQTSQVTFFLSSDVISFHLKKKGGGGWKKTLRSPPLSHLQGGDWALRDWSADEGPGRKTTWTSAAGSSWKTVQDSRLEAAGKVLHAFERGHVCFAFHFWSTFGTNQSRRMNEACLSWPCVRMSCKYCIQASFQTPQTIADGCACAECSAGAFGLLPKSTLRPPKKRHSVSHPRGFLCLIFIHHEARLVEGGSRHPVPPFTWQKTF